MRVITVKPANILTPNLSHQNFTETDKVIPKGTKLKGEYWNIAGKRKGEDFEYRLFKTENGNLIFQNKTEEIMNTEVTMGAGGLKESTPLATKIALPDNKKFANAHIIGAVVGSVAGFFIAKKMKKTGKTPYLYAIGGAAAGYVVGRMISGKPIINIKAPASMTA